MCKDDIKIAQSYISKSTSSISRGIKFELTFAQYKRLYNTLTCAYTKEKVTHGSTWSIDRMNNDEGYTQKNCVICKKDLKRISAFPIIQWASGQRLLQLRSALVLLRLALGSI